MRFRPGQHLRRQSDIRAVREQGRRVDGRAFTVWWHRRPAVALDPGFDRAAGTPAAPSAQLPTRIDRLPAVFPSAPGRPALPSSNLPRAAVVASIAAVGPAVRRNRAKRRLRELFRKHQSLIPPACDLLLIARASAVQWRFQELERAFVDACRRIAPAAAPVPPTPTHD
jgi:ribonuclease P protein component